MHNQCNNSGPKAGTQGTDNHPLSWQDKTKRGGPEGFAERISRQAQKVKKLARRRVTVLETLPMMAEPAAA